MAAMDPTTPCAAPAMAATDPTTPCAAPADMHRPIDPTTPCAAPAPEVAGSAARQPIDPTHVAHTFCYIRGNTAEATLQLLRNGQVVYGSIAPQGTCTEELHELKRKKRGADGWEKAYQKHVFTVWFNGHPTNNRPARDHVFTQVDDTSAYRLIEENPAWCVVIVEKK